MLERDGHRLRGIRRLGRRHGELEDIRRRGLIRILQHATFVREMPQIAIPRVDLLRRRGHGDPPRRGVCQRVVPAADLPLAPRGNHREIRSERRVGELESDLVVPFAGAAMGEGVGAKPARDLDLPPRDEGPRHRRAKQILPAVHGTREHRRPDEILDELSLEILDHAVVGAGGERLRPHPLELVALSDIGRDAHHACAGIMLLQPGDDHRRVQAARVGEHDRRNRTVCSGRGHGNSEMCIYASIMHK